jgi:hypothetical protein
MELLFNTALNILNFNITLLGFTFTLWHVLLYSIVAYVVVWFIFRLFK